MSAVPKPPPGFINPRPGVLKTLGILNIVFAILGGLCLAWSTMVALMGSRIVAEQSAIPEAAVRVEIKTGPPPTSGPALTATPAPGPGVPMAAGFNPLMVFEDRNFVRFSLVDNGVSLLLNGLMFATGIGLINRKRWGVRWWSNLAWVRIVTIVLLWGYYIVAVAPDLSETMARTVLKMFAGQGMAPGRVPPLAFMTRLYSITNLLTALGVMVFTSIYPGISIWLLSRPGVKAAIVDQPPLEIEQL